MGKEKSLKGVTVTGGMGPEAEVDLEEWEDVDMGSTTTEDAASTESDKDLGWGEESDESDLELKGIELRPMGPGTVAQRAPLELRNRPIFSEEFIRDGKEAGEAIAKAAATGAAVGAGIGAVVGLVGGPVGSAVGAGVGAAIGAGVGGGAVAIAAVPVLAAKAMDRHFDAKDKEAMRQILVEAARQRKIDKREIVLTLNPPTPSESRALQVRKKQRIPKSSSSSSRYSSKQEVARRGDALEQLMEMLQKREAALNEVIQQHGAEIEKLKKKEAEREAELKQLKEREAEREAEIKELKKREAEFKEMLQPHNPEVKKSEHPLKNEDKEFQAKDQRLDKQSDVCSKFGIFASPAQEAKFPRLSAVQNGEKKHERRASLS